MRPIMVGALALLLGACGGTSFSVAQGDDALSLPPPAEAAADAAAEAAEASSDVVIVDAGADVPDVGTDAIDASPPVAAYVDAGPFGYAVGQVIPSSANPNPPQDARQGTCCIPETLMPPEGQAACAVVYCADNCVPIVCGDCPGTSGGAYTQVCPAP